jgi:hypothetical protein
LHIDDRRSDGLEISTGSRRVLAFKLYVDGTIVVRAAASRMLRVERWPVMRSGLTAPTIGLRTVKSMTDDDPAPGWWGERW